MGVTPAALRFPFGRVVLPRTRLAYIHLRNLLSDAKRDRAGRISGYVAVSLIDELVIFYLVRGEVATATIRSPSGAQAVAIATALDKIPQEPEYGEVCFHEADEQQLACMFATHVAAPEPWPESMAPHDPAALFPFLMSTTFDGMVEIIANENVNYLLFRNGTVARTFLTSAPHGTVVDRVAKLFSREGRVGELKVSRWGVPQPLPTQAPPALVHAYRELSAALVQRLVNEGREDAPTVAEHARRNLIGAHPVLAGFSVSGSPTRDPVADVSALTSGVAAWIRELLWNGLDHDRTPPESLFRELTWERRHLFQSAGLFDQMPWKVM
jgi:hypothetical protein